MGEDWSGINVTPREVQDTLDKLLFLAQTIRIVQAQMRYNRMWEDSWNETFTEVDQAWMRINRVHRRMTIEIGKGDL